MVLLSFILTLFTCLRGEIELVNKLNADEKKMYDYFGHAISIYSNRVIISSYLDDDPYNSGSVYIFDYDNITHSWSESSYQKITPSDSAGYANFGRDVSIYKNRVAVGGWGGTNNDGAGTAYSYEYDSDSNEWVEVAIFHNILSQNGITLNEDDHFGCGVSISENFVIVGARKRDIYNETSNTTIEDSGAVYVFKRFSDTGSDVDNVYYNLTQIITSPEIPFEESESDWFGGNVKISEQSELVAIASQYAAGINFIRAGAVYVYRLNTFSDSFEFEEKLTASDGVPYDGFGVALSIDTVTNRKIAVGSYSGDGSNGVAYIFELRTNGNWTQTARIQPENMPNDFDGSFGRSVSFFFFILYSLFSILCSLFFLLYVLCFYN